MKTVILLALGLVGTEAGKHKHQHKHQHKHKHLNPKVLQSEIENLREQYDSLNHKYDKLSDVVKSIQTNQAQTMAQVQRSAPQPEVALHQPIQSIVQLERTHQPFQSITQLEAMPNLYGNAVDAKGKPIPGAPALPSPQPFVRGEKQWMDNGQNINDWGDKQMTVANERIPYWSTVQLETDSMAKPNLYGNAVDAKGKPIPGAPAMPSPQPFVRGEKQWMDNGQNINDWGDNQMTIANERIPYWSTFVQTEDAAPNLYGLAQGKKGEPVAGGPAMPSPQPFVRGEKQWMDNAANINTWGDTQMTVANTRIPYDSTFVHLKDDDPAKMESMIMGDVSIPLNMRLMQTKHDDDPNNIESMVMEDMELPLNARLIHVQNQEGDELIRMV